ncbi:MAG: SagB/ThcOx family dehydrogenase [Terrisporobacter sp.]
MNNINQNHNKNFQYKIYRNSNKTKLKAIESDCNCTFSKAMSNRKSIREFTNQPILLDKLSFFLRFSAGINTNRHDNSRYVPSAGAKYPIEIYMVELTGVCREKGIYHYNIKDDTIELIKKGDFRDLIYLYSHKQDCILTCTSVAIMSCVFERNQEKYGERGYRYILLDAGHICQNMYLTSTFLNLGFVAIGGFNDNEINNLIGLDGINESALYLGCLGTI